MNINDVVIADERHIEAGLLGLAFHPEYESKGYLYIYYLADNPLRAVLARYERSAVDAAVADPDSEVILVELERQTTRHNGGDLAFGPDGYLYVSVGGGSTGEDAYNNAQNRSTLFGSLIRIDVDQASDRIGLPEGRLRTRRLCDVCLELPPHGYIRGDGQIQPLCHRRLCISRFGHSVACRQIRVCGLIEWHLVGHRL